MEDYVRLHYLAWLGTIRIPEPPRCGVVRIANPSSMFNRFECFSSVEQYTWHSAADVLDLTKNYWQKTIIPGETFYWGDGCFYLVRDTDELKWLFEKLLFVDCGPKYKEDQYDKDKLQRARLLVKARREEMEERLILSLAGV